jgi:hypothetical protein
MPEGIPESLPMAGEQAVEEVKTADCVQGQPGIKVPGRRKPA